MNDLTVAVFPCYHLKQELSFYKSRIVPVRLPKLYLSSRIQICVVSPYHIVIASDHDTNTLVRMIQQDLVFNPLSRIFYFFFQFFHIVHSYLQFHVTCYRDNGRIAITFILIVSISRIISLIVERKINSKCVTIVSYLLIMCLMCTSKKNYSIL